jgi:WD40 repeat protein
MLMAADESKLATVHWQNSTQTNVPILWDIESGARLFEGPDVGVGSTTSDFAISKDATLIGLPSRDKVVRLFKPASKTVVSRLEGHSGSVGHVSFSRDGSLLVTASEDKTVRVWNAKTSKELARFKVKSPAIKAAVSVLSSRVAILERYGIASLWDLQSQRKIAQLQEWCGAYLNDAIEISYDDRFILCPCGALQVFDARTGKPVGSFDEEITAFKLHPSGHMVATSSRSGTRLWSLLSGKHLGTLHGSASNVDTIAFSSDGSRIATGSRDNTAHLWDVSTGEELAVIAHDDWVRHVEFRANGRELLTLSGGGVRRWNVSLAALDTSTLVDYLCKHMLIGVSTMTREEMRLAGYADNARMIDVCTTVDAEIE